MFFSKSCYTRIVKAFGVLLPLVGIYITGCGDKFFDPGQVGRFRPVPAVNVILDTLGVAEEAPSPWEGAEEPRPVDVVAYETDYVINPGDFVSISIFELLREGVTFTNVYVVTETGKVSIPDVGIVEAAGLTEAQLEDEIKRILKPTLLKDPSVTVAVRSSQQRSYSVLGQGARRASRYPIPRYDFRLNDALAMAGGISQFNVSNIYVTRLVTGKEPLTESEGLGLLSPEAEQKKQDTQEELIAPEDEMLEIVAPYAKQRSWENEFIITTAEMITNKELTKAALPDDFEIAAEKNSQDRQPTFADSDEQLESYQPFRSEVIDKPVKENQAGQIEWVFQDGKWYPIQIGKPEKDKPEAVGAEPAGRQEVKEEIPEGFDWDQMYAAGEQKRVIKIPTDKLSGGDPRYNILIKPGDTIHIPVDIIGEFYIMGNTNRQGFINLTGRPMTLKMAIAAAGGFGPLAWPKKVEVIRRISKNQEEVVMVDLDKIFNGEQPDFFIKPNDIVNVGTHPTARWRAVLRNSFRASYGFGFVYDRNFADRDFGTSRPFGSFFDHLLPF